MVAGPSELSPLGPPKRVESGLLIALVLTLKFNTCHLHGFLIKPDYKAVTLYVTVHRGPFQVKKCLHSRKTSVHSSTGESFLIELPGPIVSAVPLFGNYVHEIAHQNLQWGEHFLWRLCRRASFYA